MRRLLLVLFLGLLAFAVVYRQRLFVLDPLAKVTRDGAPVSGATAKINFANDVLLGEGTRVYLVQHGEPTALAPARLRCVGPVLCMTDADQATGEPIVAGSRGRREPFQGVTMTDRRVEFVDEDGGLMMVVLR